MMKLAIWKLDREGDEVMKPTPVERSGIELEKHLEDWIASDVTPIGEGLTLVGRQITIDGGRLDLLAIDAQDRWVVIEVKPGMLDSGALAQALGYASSIARLSADEFREKIEPRLGELGDAKQLSEKVKQQLEGEGEEREIALLLVGAGVHAGLERMSGFLGRYSIPISVVSFEVFELEGGPKLLVREVMDEPVAPPRRKLTVEAIHNRAVDEGVGAPFDRFVAMARDAGLAVQPQRASVRIAPPQNRTRFLMYAQPRSGDKGGELYIEVGPKQFSEFFPHISQTEAEDALRDVHGKSLGGEDLDEQLNRIEHFLNEKVRTG